MSAKAHRCFCWACLGGLRSGRDFETSLKLPRPPQEGSGLGMGLAGADIRDSRPATLNEKAFRQAWATERVSLFVPQGIQRVERRGKKFRGGQDWGLYRMRAILLPFSLSSIGQYVGIQWAFHCSLEHRDSRAPFHQPSCLP